MAYSANKTNSELGQQVSAHLAAYGVETPQHGKNYFSDDEKVQIIAPLFAQIMTTLGLDLNDDSLADTPNRVAKMYVKELFWGLDAGKFPKATTVDNKMGYQSMVCEKNITVMSACEHHFVTIDGKACVAYIPKDKVLGLSKINRIVEYFSRRPQIQERLTDQIYQALSFILDTDDVAVYIDAQHYCVKSRGVEDHSSSTITTHLGGAFLNNATTRSEFMSIATKQ